MRCPNSSNANAEVPRFVVTSQRVATNSDPSARSRLLGVKCHDLLTRPDQTRPDQTHEHREAAKSGDQVLRRAARLGHGCGGPGRGASTTACCVAAGQSPPFCWSTSCTRRSFRHPVCVWALSERGARRFRGFFEDNERAFVRKHLVDQQYGKRREDENVAACRCRGVARCCACAQLVAPPVEPAMLRFMGGRR